VAHGSRCVPLDHPLLRAARQIGVSFGERPTVSPHCG
jgi:hypothetical protein